VIRGIMQDIGEKEVEMETREISVMLLKKGIVIS